MGSVSGDLPKKQSITSADSKSTRTPPNTPIASPTESMTDSAASSPPHRTVSRTDFSSGSRSSPSSLNLAQITQEIEKVNKKQKEGGWGKRIWRMFSDNIKDLSNTFFRSSFVVHTSIDQEIFQSSE